MNQYFSVNRYLIVQARIDTRVNNSIERLTLGTKLALNRHGLFGNTRIKWSSVKKKLTTKRGLKNRQPSVKRNRQGGLL
jgi:hypothetical protein